MRREIEEVVFPTKTPFDVKPHLVLLGRRGSEAHGTYVPPTDPNGIDDRDLMGIVIPPASYYFGLDEWEGEEEINGVWDVVLYSFKKFVRLLMKQNPNVLSLLWLDPQDMLLENDAGRLLVRRKELFAERDLAYEAFVGYAHGQLHKMTSGEYKGFMGAKRKALVDKYGYDCKNAAHLVRILHMGEEFQRTGALRVKRTWDVEMIREIKRGEWGIQQVHDYTDDAFLKIAAARERSVLPEKMDRGQVNDLLVKIMRMHFAA